jgi:hypothetical protein
MMTKRSTSLSERDKQIRELLADVLNYRKIGEQQSTSSSQLEIES